MLKTTQLLEPDIMNFGGRWRLCSSKVATDSSGCFTN